MTAQTLSTVTLQTIANYRHAATLTLGAYLTGTQRLIAAVNAGLDKNVYSRTTKVAPQVTSRLVQVRDGVNGIIVKGVEQVSSRSTQAIETASTSAIAGVKRVADIAAGFDNRIVANGIETAVRLGLPGAQAALAVSARIAEGAGALSRAAGGKAPKVAKTARKVAVRKPAAVKKTAARARRKLAA
jgi:hypothetical protein